MVCLWVKQNNSSCLRYPFLYCFKCYDDDIIFYLYDERVLVNLDYDDVSKRKKERQPWYSTKYRSLRRWYSTTYKLWSMGLLRYTLSGEVLWLLLASWFHLACGPATHARIQKQRPTRKKGFFSGVFSLWLMTGLPPHSLIKSDKEYALNYQKPTKETRVWRGMVCINKLEIIGWAA